MELSFRAQSLDNIDDDTIVKDGEDLDASEEMERQKVVSRIYGVVSDKTKVLSESNITIYRGKSNFVVEAVPDKRDVRKREAPIVVYGNLPEEWSKCWGAEVRSQIKHFSDKINRSLDNKTLDAIEAGLEDVCKKKQITESFKDLFIQLGIGVIIPLLLGWMLQQQVTTQSQTSSTTPSQKTVTTQSPTPVTTPSQTPVIPASPQPVQPQKQQVTTQSQTSSTTPSQKTATTQSQTPVIPASPQPVQPQVTLGSLQSVIQTLILQIAGLIAINNALMLILPKLSITKLLNRRYRMKD